jgi:hypothetical protein
MAFAFRLADPVRVRFVLQTPEHDGALHLRRGCAGEEIGCNEDAGGAGRSSLWADLSPGTYTVVADGSGLKDSGPFTLAFQTASPVVNDACTAAIPVETGPGWVHLSASTFGASSDIEPTCSSSPGGPDVFYAIQVPARSLLTVSASSPDFPSPVLEILPACGAPAQACGLSDLDALLEPGGHVLAVDSLGADLLGSLAVSLRVQPLDALEAACAQATPLAPGVPVEGETLGEDAFSSTCAGGAPGPEAIFRIDVPARARLVASLNSHGHDGVLHVRSSCSDPGTEVACNDDRGTQSTSVVEVIVDAGTYTLFADGHGPADSGTFTLVASLEPVE